MKLSKMKFYVGILGHLILTGLMFVCAATITILGLIFNREIIILGVIGPVLIWFLYGIYLNGSKKYRAQWNQLTLTLNKGFVKEEKLEFEKDEEKLYEIEPIMTTPEGFMVKESAFIRPVTITNKRIIITQYKITLYGLSGFGVRSDSYPYYKKFRFDTLREDGKITKIEETTDEELGEGFRIFVNNGIKETTYSVYTKESKKLLEKIKKIIQ